MVIKCKIKILPAGHCVTYQMKGLDEYSSARGYTGVIKCKTKKLPKRYHVTYQMECIDE
jgi:hypothetical protein